MQQRNIPINVICKFVGNPCEAPTPIKFQFARKDESLATVSVDQVKDIEHQSPMSNHIITYRCMTLQEDCQIGYELRYWVGEMRWELSRFL